eukprot:1879079-Rhodomonas_salina.4
MQELWFLVTRWQWLLPFALNQSGSFVYYLTLGTAGLCLLNLTVTPSSFSSSSSSPSSSSLPR